MAEQQTSAETTEFENEWHVVAVCANMLGFIDLEKLLRTAETAESVGPILDPTTFRAGRENLSDQQAVLKKAIALRDAFQAVVERDIERRKDG